MLVVLIVVATAVLWSLRRASGEAAERVDAAAPAEVRGDEHAALAEIRDDEQMTPPARVVVESEESAPIAPVEGPRPQLVIRVVHAETLEPARTAQVWIEREDLPTERLEGAALRYGNDVAELAIELGTELAVDNNGIARTASPHTAVRVAARVDGFAGSAIVARNQTDCGIVLEPSHDVTILVRDARGQPCEGVFIGLGMEADFESDVETSLLVRGRRDIWVAATDESGRCVIHDLESRIDPPGNGLSPRIAPLLVDAMPALVEVNPEHPPGTIEFQLGPTGRLLVELVDNQLRKVDAVGFALVEPRRDGLRSGTQTPLSTVPRAPFIDGVATFEHVALGRRFEIDVSGRLVFVTKSTVEGPERAGESRRVKVRRL